MTETNGARFGEPKPSDPPDHPDSCPYSCPLCAAFERLRHLRPEVAQHLNAAAAEFMAAARAFLDPGEDQEAVFGMHEVDPE